MIHFVPRFVVVLTWVLIGPAMPRPEIVALIVSVFVLAMVLRRSFRYRTIAFLGILAIMVFQGLQPILLNLSFEPLGAHLLHDDLWGFLRTLFMLDMGLSIVGALGAVCAAVYIGLGKSRMSVARIFPQFKFLNAPKQVQNIVRNLANSAGIQTPETWLIDSGSPAAFTIRSKRKYTVAISIGLLESLDAKEVEACLAHEIAHLKNNDFTWRFLATVAKVALFAKPLSYLLEPAVYRAREFLADRTASILMGGPNALISALSKLGESQSYGTAAYSEAVCMCQLNASNGFFKILGKHPDIPARIRALKEMYV
jgi:Zn-dependent protease with chaperone function